MNIFVVNHSVENCGVYQYGKRFGSIASKSKKHNFMYLEIDSLEKFEELYSEHKPGAIIYNHLTGTMPWVTEEVVAKYRGDGIVQYLIVHNVGYSTFFDKYLHQNPYHESVDENNFALCRPLFEYTPTIELEDDDILRIGTFGFGFNVKHFDQICRVVNNQFHHRKVEVNMHLTSAHFCASDVMGIKSQCEQALSSPNIKLNFTTDFIPDQDMLDFLYKNDLNIFFYQNYPNYNGISSTIDYALSVQKPIAICKSNMFSHISDVQPSICVEDNSLLNIILNGFEPLQEKYNSWTNENFIHTLEEIVTN